MVTEIYTIPFNPVSVHGRYGVNLYFQKGETETQRLQFEVTVIYCGQFRNDYFVYHVIKGEHVVNTNKSEEYLYDMAKKCSTLIYPLTVWVDKNGTIIKIKSKEVMERWQKGRVELERYYQGAFAEKYFDKIEKMLKQPARVKQLITHDLFFSRLFAVIYSDVDMNHTLEQLVPLLPYSTPLKFACTQTVDTETLRDPACHSIRIDHTAQTTEKYQSDILYSRDKVNPEVNKKQVSADFKCTYRIAKEEPVILSITGDFVIRLDGECWQSTRMEAYRLRNETVLFGVDEDLIQEEKKQKKEQHSFWGKVIEFFNS